MELSNLIEYPKIIINLLDRIASDVVSVLPYADDHRSGTSSELITKIFVLILIFIVVYESIFSLGIRMKLWKDPKDKFFVKKPVHCAHVYVEVNFIETDKEISSYKEVQSFEKKLTKPLKFHIEFGPDDYDCEDPDLGSTVGFLISKLNQLVDDSAVLKTLEGKRKGDGLLYSRNKLRNKFKKDALCVQQIETGNIVNFIVRI